jgi:hypothetical protein
MIQTFKERMPIIAKMIQKGFNGDKPDAGPETEFVLIATERDDDGSSDISMITNCDGVHEVMNLLLALMADMGKEHQQAGHA